MSANQSIYPLPTQTRWQTMGLLLLKMSFAHFPLGLPSTPAQTSLTLSLQKAVRGKKNFVVGVWEVARGLRIFVFLGGGVWRPLSIRAFYPRKAFTHFALLFIFAVAPTDTLNTHMLRHFRRWQFEVPQMEVEFQAQKQVLARVFPSFFVVFVNAYEVLTFFLWTNTFLQECI